MIKNCLKENGKLNQSIIDFLTDSKDIELKLAIVNASGWKKSTNNNHTSFLDNLIRIGRYSSEKNFLEVGTRDDLIIYAYLMAMNNYFDVSKAMIFASRAHQKDQSSKAVAIIKSLIDAQAQIYVDWCKVYQLVNDANKKTGEKGDMKQTAVSAIFNYISKYRPYCYGKKSPFQK